MDESSIEPSVKKQIRRAVKLRAQTADVSKVSRRPSNRIQPQQQDQEANKLNLKSHNSSSNTVISSKNEWKKSTKLTSDTLESLYRSTNYILSFTHEQQQQQSSQDKKPPIHNSNKKGLKSKSNKKRRSRSVPDITFVKTSETLVKSSKKPSTNSREVSVNDRNSVTSKASIISKASTRASTTKISMKRKDSESTTLTEHKTRGGLLHALLKSNNKKVHDYREETDPSYLQERRGLYQTSSSSTKFRVPSTESLIVPIKKEIQAYLSACFQEKKFKMPISIPKPKHSSLAAGRQQESYLFQEKQFQKDKESTKKQQATECAPIEQFFYKRENL